MRNNLIGGFTLVELIVVITILAILGTIGFVSFSGYSRDARNSTRVSDMKVIQKGLDLNIVSFGFVPLPDDRIAISYSGGTAWNQGYFGQSAQSNIKRITSIPLDPVFSVPYAYSVVNNRRYYQLSGVFEGGSVFGKLSSPLAESYAISNTDFTSYNLGNYLDYDLVVTSESGCHVITTPSIMLSDIPAGGVLENNTPYNYSYTKSPHIANSYSGSIENSNSTTGFQNLEVYSQCDINSISELQLYNAQLSTAYQKFAGELKFKELVFNSKSNSFMLGSALSLEERGITVSKDVLDELIFPTPLQTFIDSFTDSNSVALVGGHTADSGGTWLNIPGGDSSSYSISGNEVLKNDATASKIYPRPNPEILSSDYIMRLTIVDFAGGPISLYLRYLDNDNYYRVEMSSNGYTIYQNIGGTETSVSDVVEVINPGSEIIYSVEGDNIDLTIAGAPKGSSVLGGINARGNPVIWMENIGAKIDNYSLIYK